MKVDVKHAKVDGVWDGSSISIESGEDLVMAPGDTHVGIHTNNAPGWENGDELWIVKRKAFLKAVAKALNVVIWDAGSDPYGDEAGYYR